MQSDIQASDRNRVTRPLWFAANKWQGKRGKPRTEINGYANTLAPCRALASIQHLQMGSENTWRKRENEKMKTRQGHRVGERSLESKLNRKKSTVGRKRRKKKR